MKGDDWEASGERTGEGAAEFDPKELERLEGELGELLDEGARREKEILEAVSREDAPDPADAAYRRGIERAQAEARGGPERGPRTRWAPWILGGVAAALLIAAGLFWRSGTEAPPDDDRILLGPGDGVECEAPRRDAEGRITELEFTVPADLVEFEASVSLFQGDVTSTEARPAPLVRDDNVYETRWEWPEEWNDLRGDFTWRVVVRDADGASTVGWGEAYVPLR